MPDGMKPTLNKKKMHLFFLIDVSLSMRGRRISAVNTAMKTVVTKLKEYAASHGSDKTVEYVVRVLTFGGHSHGWKYGTALNGINLDNYDWVDIPASECQGGTPMGECIDTLMEVMSDENREECLGKRISAPLLMMISDGASTGERDPEEAAIAVQNTTLGNVAYFTAIGIDVRDNEVTQKTMKTFGRNGFCNVDDDPGKLAGLISQITLKSVKFATVHNDTKGNGTNNQIIYSDSDLL